jgi:protein SCO1/2
MLHFSRAASAALLVLGCVLGCRDSRPATAAVRGVELGAPLPRPSFTLTATNGKPYAFAEETSGKLTLLFFGYTNCPDVCPVHAANIAEIIKRLPWEDRQRVTFVFVTTDPDRDSLPQLRKYLDNFDSTFVGLRGPLEEVNEIQRKLNLGTLPPGEKAADGSYEVGHASVVLAIEPDDSLRVMYAFPTRQQDWAADIPMLLKRHAKR